MMVQNFIVILLVIIVLAAGIFGWYIENGRDNKGDKDENIIEDREDVK